ARCSAVFPAIPASRRAVQTAHECATRKLTDSRRFASSLRPGRVSFLLTHSFHAISVAPAASHPTPARRLRYRVAEGAAMTNVINRYREQGLEIFIGELIEDEEFRDSFLRNPRQTLGQAAEWGLPISDSEMRALLASDPSDW